jgi:hypothetical protein
VSHTYTVCLCGVVALVVLSSRLFLRRKEKADVNIRDASRASLTFFAIELTGCLGPEAQRLCTQLTGEKQKG